MSDIWGKGREVPNHTVFKHLFNLIQKTPLVNLTDTNFILSLVVFHSLIVVSVFKCGPWTRRSAPGASWVADSASRDTSDVPLSDSSFLVLAFFFGFLLPQVTERSEHLLDQQTEGSLSDTRLYPAVQPLYVPRHPHLQTPLPPCVVKLTPVVWKSFLTLAYVAKQRFRLKLVTVPLRLFPARTHRRAPVKPVS